jgi:hypothetical protein
VSLASEHPFLMEVRGPVMKSFLFTFRPRADHVVDSPEVQQAWQAYLEELEPSLIDAGNPVFVRQQVGQCGADTVLGGYSIVSADDLSAAVGMARGCPVLSAGGGVEVGELTRLNPEHTDQFASATESLPGKQSHMKENVR